MSDERKRIALDVNFPEPILRCLAEFMPDIELVPLRTIDVGLTELDDRELMIALQQEGFDWLVTNNYKMLRNPQELAAILATRVTVFAIEGTGDDPLRATGALLLDLPGALKRARTGQVFWSRPRNPDPQPTWELFELAARRRHSDPQALYEEVRLTNDERTRPWRGEAT